jgi:hypothetical protein
MCKEGKVEVEARMGCVIDRLVNLRGTKKAHCEEKSAKPRPREIYVPCDGTLDPM